MQIARARRGQVSSFRRVGQSALVTTEQDSRIGTCVLIDFLSKAAARQSGGGSNRAARFALTGPAHGGRRLLLGESFRALRTVPMLGGQGIGRDHAQTFDTMAASQHFADGVKGFYFPVNDPLEKLSAGLSHSHLEGLPRLKKSHLKVRRVGRFVRIS
jgi:hypothetical protein